MAKFKKGDLVRYRGSAGKLVCETARVIAEVTEKLYHFRDKGSINIKLAEKINGPFELELAAPAVFFTDCKTFPTDLDWWSFFNTRKNTQEEKPIMKYHFNISSNLAIRFEDIYKDLTPSRPIAKVCFKSDIGEIEYNERTMQNRTSYNREYYVVIHSSIWEKSDIVGIESPNPFAKNVGWSALYKPEDYAAWINWAKNVVNAPWPGDSGVVSVEIVEA